MAHSLYQQLDASRKEVRVIRLPDNHDSAQLNCTLETISLLDERAYHALSYTWGSSLPPATIVINGCAVTVGGNLAAALRHFSTVGDGIAIPLWIDAISINQKDILERNSQVAFMGEIYERAAVVHVWLGGPEIVSKAQMHALRALAQFIITPGRWLVNHEDNTSLAQLKHLSLLMHNPYWKRTWILQEIYLAEFIVIHGDGERVSISDPIAPGHKLAIEYLRHKIVSSLYQYSSSLMRLRNANHLERERFEGMKAIAFSELSIRIRSDMDDILSTLEPMAEAASFRRVAILIDQGETWWLRYSANLVTNWRDFLASDPRDKIYGTLSLLPHTYAGIRPDYTKAVSEVYCEAALKLLSGTDGLEVLQQACSGNTGLPTWVPDFSIPVTPSWLRRRVSGSNPSNQARVVKEAQSNGLLKVAGKMCDKLKAISRGANVHNLATTDDVRSHLARWHAMFESIAAPSLPKSHPDRQHAFWRAVGAGAIDVYDFYSHRTEEIRETISRLDDIFLNGKDDSFLIGHLRQQLSENDFFVTDLGHAGLAPAGRAAARDTILILAGAEYPFCARKAEPEVTARFALIGPCFVENGTTDPSESPHLRRIMDGSAILGEAKDCGFGEDVDRLFEEIFLE